LPWGDSLNKGYTLKTQFGASGYKIDIVVMHPEIAERPVLAIECDGATYHSSKTARDRDILRQSILESLGWVFHRIWSTNWLHDNLSEKTRLINAIETSIKGYYNQGLSNNEIEKNDFFDEIKIEKQQENLSDELDKIYYSWRKALIEKFGFGSYNYNGWLNNNSWNSLSVMENCNAIEEILNEVLKFKNGFSPEDVFREINEKVFDKNRYTEQAKEIYEDKFQQYFLDTNKVELIDNTIKIKF
jgi:very-short-patch-repair endonuclease